MVSDKKYYWIKLKKDFFDLDTIDWLSSQKNGCEYIVLYQKLCLLTANSNGRMVQKIGEMIIPYDAYKISRDTKFHIDTVVVALELFKKIGLILTEENGILIIPNVENMIGSESKWAEKKRVQRTKKEDNVQMLSSTQEDNVPLNIKDNVRQEKELDIELDIDKDIELDIEYKSGKKHVQFDTPTAKKHYAEFVTMTNDEYKSLVDDERLGSVAAVNRCIEILDNYKGSSGRKYKSDYRAILNWVVDRYCEEISKNNKHTSNNNGLDELLELAREGG